MNALADSPITRFMSAPSDYAFLQILQYPVCHHLVAVNEGIPAAYAVVSVGIIKRIKLLSCFDEGVDKINGVLEMHVVVACAVDQ